MIKGSYTDFRNRTDFPTVAPCEIEHFQYTDLYLWGNRLVFYISRKEMNIEFPIIYVYALNKPDNQFVANYKKIWSWNELCKILEDAPYKGEIPARIGDISFVEVLRYFDEIKCLGSELAKLFFSVPSIARDIMEKNDPYFALTFWEETEPLDSYISDLRGYVSDLWKILPLDYAIEIKR